MCVVNFLKERVSGVGGRGEKGRGEGGEREGGREEGRKLGR